MHILQHMVCILACKERADSEIQKILVIAAAHVLTENVLGDKRWSRTRVWDSETSRIPFLRKLSDLLQTMNIFTCIIHYNNTHELQVMTVSQNASSWMGSFALQISGPTDLVWRPVPDGYQNVPPMAGM